LLDLSFTTFFAATLAFAFGFALEAALRAAISLLLVSSAARQRLRFKSNTGRIISSSARFAD
jgi:hypothetical protein